MWKRDGKKLDQAAGQRLDTRTAQLEEKDFTAGNHTASHLCPRVDFISTCLPQFPFSQYLPKSVLLTDVLLGASVEDWITNATL